jgi:hypothetical protein
MAFIIAARPDIGGQREARRIETIWAISTGPDTLKAL